MSDTKDEVSRDAAQIETLRLEWVGLHDTLTRTRKALLAEVSRWDELRPTYGRRTRQYRTDRMQALDPFICANDAAFWAIGKFERQHGKGLGLRLPWEAPKTQESTP